jgi:hypothetical protein
MKDISVMMIYTMILGLCIFIVLVYALFNGVLALSCLASEGNVIWNKVVVACHFDDAPNLVQQIITNMSSSSVESKCLLNGQYINCSDIKSIRK